MADLPGEFSHLRVWLIHDWLTGLRGGEKVLLELVRMFPQSRIATLLHVPGKTDPEIDKRVEQISFLQKIPGVARQYRNYLPLFPRAVRSLQLDGPCDLVISVSHAVAKGVRVPKGASHLCICLTPMRYIWGMEDQYLAKRSPKRMALAAVRPMLQRFDRRNTGVTQFISISRNIADRIQRFYGRASEVVYPGIDEHYWIPGNEKREDFYLIVSAFVAYKRVDLAVKAFLANGKRLVLIGGGPEEAKLKSLAKSAANIQFLGRQSDEVVRENYQRCRAFLFPGEEDFGLTPVEAQACCAPVVAYRAGGVVETVVDGETGVFFDEQTAEGLIAGIDRLEKTALYAERCRNNALNFTWSAFQQGVARIVTRMTRQQ